MKRMHLLRGDSSLVSVFLCKKYPNCLKYFSMKKSLLGSTCLQTKKLVQQEVGEVNNL